MRMLLACLWLAVVGAAGSAHGAPQRAPSRKLASAKPSSEKKPATVLEQLAALQAAQNDAVRSGDPQQTARATQVLLAKSLLLLAEVRLVQGNKATTADLSALALSLEDTPESRLEWASLLLRTGKSAQAAALAEPVTATDPQNASAWMILASALRASGEAAAAIPAYQHAVVLNPDTSVAHALASTYLAVHQVAEAKALFQQIFAATDNAAIWHVAAGDAYREARYLNEAIAEFKQAIAIDPTVPHAEFFLGLTYLQQNEWGPDSQSFEHLRKAALEAPKEYISNFYLGALESTDGSDLQSSDRHLHIAAEADPSQPEVWLYLGLNANREHKTEEAERQLRRSIEVTGTDESRNNYQVRRAYFALGRLLIAAGNRPEGSALLERYRAAEQAAVAASGSAIVATALAEPGSAAARNGLSLPPGMMAPSPLAAEPVAAAPLPTAGRPELAESEAVLRHILASGFNDLGTAQARQKQYAAAFISFGRAEPWEPPTPGLLQNLGVAAVRTEHPNEAIRAFRAYFQADPAAAGTDQRTRLLLAYAEFSTGAFSSAADDFSRARERTLADPRAAYSWSFSLAQSGKMVEANQLAAALEQQPLPAEQLSLVCNVYVTTENYEGSLRCFRKLYALAPSLPLAHYQAGQALVRLERPQEALPELKQELALNPGNADVQYALAFALLQASQKQEAKTLLLSLTTSAPEQAQAQYQLGKLLLEEGQTALAAEHLERSEQDDPTPDYVHYQLGTAYRKLNRGADADRELKLFRAIKDRKREPTASAAR